MQIRGFQKTTLLDYPGQIAATVFTGGCNFQCPFCHNGDLLLKPEKIPEVSQEEIVFFLEKRKEILDGVCITGGEPTLQPDLEQFIIKIKQKGLKVKLDTNGYRPDVLMDLCRKNLIDYVAMDIKGTPEQYAEITGVKSLDIEQIQTSIYFLMNQSLPYEFRTTVVKEFHSEEDLIRISQWIRGAKAYYLQNYQDSEQVINRQLHGYRSEEIKRFGELIKNILPSVQIRGVN